MTSEIVNCAVTVCSQDCLQLAEGRTGANIKGRRCSDHGRVRQKDDILYQTVLCKNAELGSASVPHVYRDILVPLQVPVGGDTSSS